VADFGGHRRPGANGVRAGMASYLRTLSVAQLHPSHLAPCIEIRCYLVVIQHMKREDYSSLVYGLLLITILEQFLFMTFLITAE